MRGHTKSSMSPYVFYNTAAEDFLFMIKILFVGFLHLMFFQGWAQTVSTIAWSSSNKNQYSIADTILAFPGAEGFGKFTTGGRGGKVLVVTNLNDDGRGSLRAAISDKEPRIIVFAVSGNILLESSLDINHGNLTIAGQSAPGEGITIQNYPIKINGDNIIIRYLRSRMGDENKVEDDAISALRQKNIIVDHCSFSWGTDESASFYDNENFTLQWSIISESLNKSVHKKGEHGYGGIWGGKGASFHHNLLAHHKSRLPRFNGARTHLKHQPEKEIVDFRNNVIYNWKSNSAYAGERGNHNMVNNYYKSGPATKETVRGRIVEPWSPYGSFHVTGNYVAGFPEVSSDNRKGVYGDAPDSAIAFKPIAVMEISVQSAEEAYAEVLAHVGASYARDAVDRRIIEEVHNETAKFGVNKDGIIDSQKDVGGWPMIKSSTSPADIDKDGMPDEWEKNKNLNPNSANDAVAYTLDKNYTNIEVYLNSLVSKTALKK